MNLVKDNEFWIFQFINQGLILRIRNHQFKQKRTEYRKSDVSIVRRSRLFDDGSPGKFQINATNSQQNCSFCQEGRESDFLGPWTSRTLAAMLPLPLQPILFTPPKQMLNIKAVLQKKIGTAPLVGRTQLAFKTRGSMNLESVVMLKTERRFRKSHEFQSTPSSRAPLFGAPRLQPFLQLYVQRTPATTAPHSCSHLNKNILLCSTGKMQSPINYSHSW